MNRRNNLPEHVLQRYEMDREYVIEYKATLRYNDHRKRATCNSLLREYDTLLRYGRAPYSEGEQGMINGLMHMIGRLFRDL